MWEELPHDLALIIFDLAVASDSRDAPMAKVLRQLNRECAMRYARPVSVSYTHLTLPTKA